MKKNGAGKAKEEGKAKAKREHARISEAHILYLEQKPRSARPVNGFLERPASKRVYKIPSGELVEIVGSVTDHNTHHVGLIAFATGNIHMKTIPGNEVRREAFIRAVRVLCKT